MADNSNTRNSGGGEQLRSALISFNNGQERKSIDAMNALSRLADKEPSGLRYKEKKEALELAKEVFRGIRPEKVVASNGKEIHINGKFLGEVFAKNEEGRFVARALDAAVHIVDWAHTLRFIQTERGKHHKNVFYRYSGVYKGKSVILKVKVTDNLKAYNVDIR